MDNPHMNFKWSSADNRHFLSVPHPTDPTKEFDIATMDEDQVGEYWYIITGRLYSYAEDDDFDELGQFDSLGAAKEALEKFVLERFTEEFKYWNNIMGVVKSE